MAKICTPLLENRGLLFEVLAKRARVDKPIKGF
jgi:hypothetical protein